MEKKMISYEEMRDKMFEFNRTHVVPGDECLYAVVVMTEDSFDKPYTETERSYAVTNMNKGFMDGKISNSVWSNCLDGKDTGVRLDWYIGDGWKVQGCYFVTEEELDELMKKGA